MAKSANYILAPLAMPHHSAIVAMVVLGAEEANGKDGHRNTNYCPHDEVKDGHVTLPGKRLGEPDPPVFPKILSYKKNSLLSVI